MRLGISMFTAEDAIGPDALARSVEAAGFDSIWFPDHTHLPVGGSSRWPWDPTQKAPLYYAEIFDVFVALTAAASATRRVRIGSAVCVLPQRDPIVAAKQAASIDRLSGGRLMVGVGPGWNAEEMANHGVKYDDRYDVMRERIDAMKAIWSSEIAEFHGEHVEFGPMRLGPRPAQPGGPPVLIAGESDRALRRAARHADGWLPRGRELAPQGVVERVRDFRAATEAAGRGHLPVVVLDTGHDPRDLDAYAEAGVDAVIFRLPPTPPAEVPSALDRVMTLARRAFGASRS